MRHPAFAAVPAVLVTALLAGAGSAHSAPPAARVFPTPIRHVVVLYLENQSFDSVLGYWCDQTHRCVGLPKQVTLADGAVVAPRVTPDKVPDVVHSVTAQQAAINGGAMNGWDQIPGCTAAQNYRCITGYKPAHIPNITSLAQTFAVSDETFSMADSPSWGGHLYAVMPTLDGFTGDDPMPVPGVTPGRGWGCDSNKTAPWINPATHVAQQEPSCVPDKSLGIPNGGAFEPTDVRYTPTIMDRVAKAGLSWRIYGSHYNQSGYSWATCPSIAECLYTKQDTHVVDSAIFTVAAAAGKLPNFSLVLPGGSTTMDSEHNGTSMTKGDNWVGQVASAVMNGPEWKSTALFITWDDCGCFYDQVRPGVNPDNTPQGPRVPMVIVSPYARPGYTDSTPTTFAGILAYTEHVFGLPALGVNDADAYDFSGAFNYSQKPLPPVRMVRRPVPASSRHLPLINPGDPT